LLATLPGLANPGAVEDIMLYAESIQLPGLQLATTPIRNNGYGPLENKPYMPVFGETIPITFYVDTKGFILDFFHTWMRTAINYTTEGGGFNTTKFNNSSPFEVNYKPKYQADMEILVLDQDEGGKIIKTIKVLKTFPVSIPDTTMSYNSTDSILTLTVMFSYFEWYSLKLADRSNVPSVNMIPDTSTNPTIPNPNRSRQDSGAPGGGPVFSSSVNPPN
jgi:hypothetical protein